MEYRFQVNLSGIIDLLSNHLYSGPQVFLRELLQNATDAIARPAASRPRPFAGGHPHRGGAASPAPPTLLFEDDGVGLDRGARSTASWPPSAQLQARAARGAARADFIGQFGIGLLSCFMVADEIVMITRPATGRDDGTRHRVARPARRHLRRPAARQAARRRARASTSAASRAAESFFDPRRVRELAAPLRRPAALPGAR